MKEPELIYSGKASQKKQTASCALKEKKKRNLSDVGLTFQMKGITW